MKDISAMLADMEDKNISLMRVFLGKENGTVWEPDVPESDDEFSKSIYTNKSSTTEELYAASAKRDHLGTRNRRR